MPDKMTCVNALSAMNLSCGEMETSYENSTED